MTFSSQRLYQTLQCAFKTEISLATCKKVILLLAVIFISYTIIQDTG